MNLLSIVVPVYGVEPWIRRCLSSIVDQPEFKRCCELIIVDDGSPDRSVEIAKEVCGSAPNIHLIRQANQGLGAARNTGAAAARGQFLWFVDSDDWLTPEGLPRVVLALERDPDLDALNIEYAMSNGSHSVVINRADPNTVYEGLDYLSRSIVESPVQYYVWSTAHYRNYRLHFESDLYHEDTLFTPIALFYARRVRRLAVDCYVYNLREGSIMSSGKTFKHAMDMVDIVNRLESFRATVQTRGTCVLAKYSAIAVGGIYFYWKKLSPEEKVILAKRLSLLRLVRPVLRSGRLKYLLSIIHINLSFALGIVARR